MEIKNVDTNKTKLLIEFLACVLKALEDAPIIYHLYVAE